MKSITPKGSTPRQPGGSIGSEDPPHYLGIPNGTFTIFDRVSGAHAVAVPPRWGAIFPIILNLRLSICFKDACVTCRRGLPACSCDRRAGPQRVGPRTSNDDETDRCRRHSRVSA